MNEISATGFAIHPYVKIVAMLKIVLHSLPVAAWRWTIP